MEHFDAFHSEGELLPPFCDLEPDLHQCAEIIQQLDFICAQLPAENFYKTTARIKKKFAEAEMELLAQFDKASVAGDLDQMRRHAHTLFPFESYVSANPVPPHYEVPTHPVVTLCPCPRLGAVHARVLMTFRLPVHQLPSYQRCVDKFIERFIAQHSSEFSIPNRGADFNSATINKVTAAIEATAIKAKSTINDVFMYPQQIVAQFLKEIMKTVQFKFIKVSVTLKPLASRALSACPTNGGLVHPILIQSRQGRDIASSSLPCSCHRWC